MKTYRHLWEQLITDENITTAIENASKGKRDRNEVKQFYDHKDEKSTIDYVRNFVENYIAPDHQIKTIREGTNQKTRVIVIPTFIEQIVHHMVIQVMMPMLTKGMYEHTYASIPGRGIHAAKEQIEKWIHEGGRNIKHCAKLDIKKFYDSVDQDILIRKLGKKIKDKKFLYLLTCIIHSVDHGLPLGFYTSTWFANWLLQELDHLIAETWHIKRYVRFMDDMTLFASSKAKLHEVVALIQEWLCENHMRLKENYQVFRFNRGKKYRALDFIGFKFYRTHTTLRKSILRSIHRKALAIDKHSLQVFSARQMLSYLGYIKAADVYDWYKKHVKPHVSMQKCKRCVSRYERRIQNENKLLSSGRFCAA